MSANTEYLRGQIEERAGALSRRPNATFTERGNDVWARRSGRTFLNSPVGGARDFSSPVAGSGMGNLSRLVGGKKKAGRKGGAIQSIQDGFQNGDAKRIGPGDAKRVGPGDAKRIGPGNSSNMWMSQGGATRVTKGQAPVRTAPAPRPVVKYDRGGYEAPPILADMSQQREFYNSLTPQQRKEAEFTMSPEEKYDFRGATPEERLSVLDRRNPNSQYARGKKAFDEYRADYLANPKDPFSKIVKGLTKIGDYGVDAMSSGWLSGVPGAKAIGFLGKQGSKLNPFSKNYDSGYDEGTKGIKDYALDVGKDAAMEVGKYALEKGKDYLKNKAMSYLQPPEAPPSFPGATTYPPRSGNTRYPAIEDGSRYPAIEDGNRYPAIQDAPRAPAPAPRAPAPAPRAPTSRPAAPRPPPPPPPVSQFPGGAEAFWKGRPEPVLNPRLGAAGAESWWKDFNEWQKYNRGKGGAMNDWADFTTQHLRGNLHPRRARHLAGGNEVLNTVDLLQQGQNQYEGAGRAATFQYSEEVMSMPPGVMRQRAMARERASAQRPGSAPHVGHHRSSQVVRHRVPGNAPDKLVYGRATKAEKEALHLEHEASEMGMSLDAHLKHNKVPAAKRRTIIKRVANARRKMGE